jgi:hypothetical protein
LAHVRGPLEDFNFFENRNSEYVFNLGTLWEFDENHGLYPGKEKAGAHTMSCNFRGFPGTQKTILELLILSVTSGCV